MSAEPSPSAAAPQSPQLQAGLVAFAVVQLALAAFMAIAPHTFYTAIGPFGARNDHYVRDVSTFYAAIGIALAVAVRRPSWRVPALAITTIQFALHTINHLVDIGRAHPRWVGWFDFLSLLGATLQLAVLWRIAARVPPIPVPALQPLAERTTP
jgi:hypothetical protein